ncbi:MAG: MFS transporter [Acetobacteraceae bacterium]
MSPSPRIARLLAGRVDYAWVVAFTALAVIICSVGVRAAPGVLIVPLEKAFGWDTATISGAISLNIALFGLGGPFAAALMRTIGLRATVFGSMALLVLGAGLSGFITRIWELYLTWGVLVGLGSSLGMMALAVTVANRWFVERRGLVVGMLTAGNASGQLIFLPLLAHIAGASGWRFVPWTAAGVMAALIPVVWLLLAESPAAIGAVPFGAAAPVAEAPLEGNPFRIAMTGLARGAGSLDFWLLAGSFSICGFSTYGLVITHLIPFCADHGISAVNAASVLAAIGVFDFMGTLGSGWLTDRYDSRILLFWYYGLRGISLLWLPFSGFDPISLGIFAVFFGLDFVATVPPTVALTTQIFGKRDAPVVASWISAGHQLGGAAAALGAGIVRTETGSYVLAFAGSGVLCFMASLLVLRIGRRNAVAVA